MPTFRIHFTADHMVEGYLRYRWQSRQWITWSLLGLIVVAGAALALAGHAWIGLALAAAALLLLAAVQSGESRKRKRLMHSPFRDMHVDISFSDSGVHLSTESQDLRIGWGNLHKAVRFSDGLLLFIGPRAYLWIADHELPTPEAAAALTDLAGQRARRYRVIR